jgi:hypothetical protein
MRSSRRRARSRAGISRPDGGVRDIEQCVTERAGQPAEPVGGVGPLILEVIARHGIGDVKGGIGGVVEQTRQRHGERPVVLVRAFLESLSSSSGEIHRGNLDVLHRAQILDLVEVIAEVTRPGLDHIESAFQRLPHPFAPIGSFVPR